MPSLTFIGLGLNDEKGITLEGLEEARQADVAFTEFYTNIMPSLDLENLEKLIGKKIGVLNRTQLEDDGGRELLHAARKGRVVFLVPGDPMIATTHISIRLSLIKLGISSRVIHGSSIISAICGATGLQSYKFGKSITIPRDPPFPKSVLDTISDNYDRGLHCLILLDVNASETSQMSISDALAKMIRADPDLKTRLAVGAARLGTRDERAMAARIGDLVNRDFGGPPHSIVMVGKPHFMEIEALKALCGASDEDLRENS